MMIVMMKVMMTMKMIMMTILVMMMIMILMKTMIRLLILLRSPMAIALCSSPALNIMALIMMMITLKILKNYDFHFPGKLI